MFSSDFVTLAFGTALIVGLLVKIWLAARQIRHVAMHRADVPHAFVGCVELASHQKAADYTITKTRFGLIEIALGTLMLLAWTLLGGLNALNHALLHLLGSGMWQQLALLVAFSLVSALIEMPLAVYQTFVIEERFGFNKTTPKLWLVDLLKSMLVGAVVGLPLAWLILYLMGAAGSLWWLWAWGVWMAFNLLLLLIYPTFIAPLFNKFEPLQDMELKARVTALMKRCGFSAKGLFVMDGSRRSAHANAYFTGFGTSKRVVFYDTLLRQLSPAEVDAVLAHELGHFKHRHIVKRIGGVFMMSLVGLFCLGWLSVQASFYSGLGVQPNLGGPNDAVALLLFALVLPVFTFFVTPLFSLFSRKHEFEADAYACALTNGGDLRSALLKLYRDNASTLTPDPWFVKFYYSHPSAAERLARMGT